MHLQLELTLGGVAVLYVSVAEALQLVVNSKTSSHVGITAVGSIQAVSLCCDKIRDKALLLHVDRGRHRPGVVADA